MRFVLSIGSNVNPVFVQNALLWLGKNIGDMESSSVYETPPVHNGSRPYSNAVVTGSTETSFDEFNKLLKIYEISCGRNDEARLRGDVPVDIDIVVCDGEVIRPWDYRQNFFRIGFSELSGSPVQN